MNLSEIRTAISCNDILLVPCPSDLESTSQADISINLDKLPCPFKASLPIINSPMDMVTSKELLTLLLGRNIPVTIHRYYDSPDKQLEFFNEVLKDTWGQYPETLSLNACNIFISVGSVFKWKDWIDTLLNYRKVSNIKFGVLIDMANGDTKACIETVKYLRTNCEDLNIMAGNVATKGGFSRLQSAGANLIRCGIGGGCFVAGTKVLVKNSNIFEEKSIENVKTGDIVLTHKNNEKEVYATLSFKIDGEYLYTINDKITCTEKHKHFVVHNKYKNLINNYDDIVKFGEWIETKDLTTDYNLVELENELAVKSDYIICHVKESESKKLGPLEDN